MKPFLVPVALLLGALALSGCNDSSSDDPVSGPDPTSELRVLHASPDGPKVNVLVGGDAVLDGVDYKIGSGYLTVPADTLTVAVDGILPGGNTATVIGPVDLDIESDTRYTVVAFGEVAAIQPLVVSVPDATIASHETRVQVLHAAPAVPEIDVFVVDPDISNPTGLAPLGAFDQKETLGPLTMPAGEYRILVTLAGDTGVVFDSGPVTLSGGADLLLAAVNNTATGHSPISLVAMDRAGSFEILDTNTPANVRFVHASPDAPAVNVVVNDHFGDPLVPGLAFPEATDYLAPLPGEYNIKVVPAGTPNAVIDADVTFEAGERHTVVAVGLVSDLSIEPMVLVDDGRRVATEAKVRLVHASTLADEVDIYFTEPGASLDASTPTFTSVPFKADTGYVSLPKGTYDVSVTQTGSTTPVLGPIDLTLEAGGVYGAIVRDSAGPDPALPLGLIALDDLDLAGPAAPGPTLPSTNPEIVKDVAFNGQFAVPEDLKTSCTSGDTEPESFSPLCETMVWDDLTYWALSFTDNRLSMAILAVDADGEILKRWDRNGARYLWKIVLDEDEETATFVGQGELSFTMDWKELVVP